MHVFNSSTREAEAGGSLNLRQAWTTERVPEQPELYRETLSQKKINKQTLHNWAMKRFFQVLLAQEVNILNLVIELNEEK